MTEMETYHGHVRTPTDAIILFEACRLGLLPRVQRRLSEKERQSIRSGSVFVWDEREAGMRRWTDGKSWSASRVSGSFLTYREMEGKRGGTGFAPPVARAGKTPDSGRASGDDSQPQEPAGAADVEDGPDGYRYKQDGLMKQSFSITTSQNQHLHLISYYARSANAPSLPQPSNDPNLRTIRPQKGMYPESSIVDQSSVPAVTRTPMVGAPNYNMPQPPLMYAQHGATTHAQPHYMAPAYAHHPPPGYAYPPSPINTPPGYPLQYHPGQNGLPPIAHPGALYGHPPPAHLAMPGPPYDQRATRPLDSQLPPPPAMAAMAAMAPYSSPPASGPAATAQRPSSKHESPSQQAAAALQIDPRLFGTAPAPANRANGALPRIDSPPGGKPAENGIVTGSGSSATHPPTNAASQAPTIGAIMNGTTPTDRSEDEAASGVAKPDHSADEGESTSPGGTKQGGGPPQDIPSEKLGFREDKRALRQLDKVFTA